MKNRKNKITHDSDNKIGIATGMRAAAAKTNIPIDLIQAAKWKGCVAFRLNGTVDCDQLSDFIRADPQLWKTLLAHSAEIARAYVEARNVSTDE
jgi:hypothetical protein